MSEQAAAPPRLDKLFSLGATATRSLGRLALSVAVVRALGGRAFATYALLLVVETVALTLLVCRSAAPLTTLAPGRPPAERPALLAWAWRVQRWDVGVASALGLAAAWLARPWLPLEVALPFLCATALSGLARTPRGWRLARFQAHRVFASELLSALPPLALCAAVLAGQAGSLAGLFWAMSLGNLAALAALYERPAPSRPRPELQHEAERMGRSMLAGSLGYSLGSRSQPFALAQVGGAALVAPFAAALTVSGPLRMLSMATDVVLRPRLAHARRDRAAFGRLLAGAGALQLACGLSGLAALLLVGDPLVRLLYGSELPGLRAALGWALGYVTLESLASSGVVALQARGGALGAATATRLRLGVSLLSLALLLPACAWGGVAGAFLALIGCELAFLGLVLRALAAREGASQAESRGALAASRVSRGRPLQVVSARRG